MKKLAAPILLAAALVALPGSAARAQTPADACKQPLDPDRREVKEFVAGGKTLGYGQVVVQATQAKPFTFCVKVQFGGRTVTHESSNSGYEWRDGMWVKVGSAGSGVYQARGYTQTLTVAKGTRTDVAYGIRDGGTWYYARISKGRV